MTEAAVIQALKEDNRQVQKWLYNKYSRLFLGIARRYVIIHEDAEDVLLEAFFKIFKNIGQFSGNGSFEGWMKRIVINESLMFIRKNHNFKLQVEISNVEIKTKISVQDELQAQDILKLLEKLPTGYRTVFNLYVIEGFKHREIAEKLGISINTSKSQLILAKKRLKDLILKQELGDVGSVSYTHLTLPTILLV